MYIHESVQNNMYINDKKLQLLNQGVITIGQFINLIDINDPYTIIGPAIVAKDKINEFLEEWKTSAINLKKVEDSILTKIDSETIFEQLDAINKIFPELTPLITQYYNESVKSNCPACKKNKFLLNLVNRY